MIVKLGSSSPTRDENKKYLSCHHLVGEIIYFLTIDPITSWDGKTVVFSRVRGIHPDTTQFSPQQHWKTRTSWKTLRHPCINILYIIYIYLYILYSKKKILDYIYDIYIYLGNLWNPSLTSMIYRPFLVGHKTNTKFHHHLVWRFSAVRKGRLVKMAGRAKNLHLAHVCRSFYEETNSQANGHGTHFSVRRVQHFKTMFGSANKLFNIICYR